MDRRHPAASQWRKPCPALPFLPVKLSQPNHSQSLMLSKSSSVWFPIFSDSSVQARPRLRATSALMARSVKRLMPRPANGSHLQSLRPMAATIAFRRTPILDLISPRSTMRKLRSIALVTRLMPKLMLLLSLHVKFSTPAVTSVMQISRQFVLQASANLR